jgi:hypothetical protein
VDPQALGRVVPGGRYAIDLPAMYHTEAPPHTPTVHSGWSVVTNIPGRADAISDEETLALYDVSVRVRPDEGIDEPL